MEEAFIKDFSIKLQWVCRAKPTKAVFYKVISASSSLGLSIIATDTLSYFASSGPGADFCTVRDREGVESVLWQREPLGGTTHSQCVNQGQAPVTRHDITVSLIHTPSGCPGDPRRTCQKYD